MGRVLLPLSEEGRGLKESEPNVQAAARILVLGVSYVGITTREVRHARRQRESVDFIRSQPRADK